MKIASIMFDGSNKVYQYLIRNMTAKTDNPFYLSPGNRIKIIRGTGPRDFSMATVVHIQKEQYLPPKVSKYLQINNNSLKFYPMYIPSDKVAALSAPAKTTVEIKTEKTETEKFKWNFSNNPISELSRFFEFHSKRCKRHEEE